MGAAPTVAWAGPELAAAPDLDRLRRDRGDRLRMSMLESGIDALILLGTANVAYATGAGSPTGWPGLANVERQVAVVLVDDPMPHLFTPFLAEAATELGLDDDHLHGPPYLDLAEGVERFVRAVDALVPHLATIGVDEVTGAMRFLDADIIDAGPALRSVRRTKTPDEVAAIGAAARIADAALTAAVAEVRPGRTERELNGAVAAALAEHDVATPVRHDVARVTSLRHGGGAGPREQVRMGDLVAFHVGVVAGGYHAEVGRTWPVGRRPGEVGVGRLYRRWDELWARLFDACQPGAPASALLDAYRAAGEPLPVMPVGRGLGLGFDDPVISRHLPETAALERLDPGVVLLVTGCVFDEAVGSVIAHEPVCITTDGPEVLSSSPFWNRDRVGARP